MNEWRRDLMRELNNIQRYDRMPENGERASAMHAWQRSKWDREYQSSFELHFDMKRKKRIILVFTCTLHNSRILLRFVTQNTSKENSWRHKQWEYDGTKKKKNKKLTYITMNDVWILICSCVFSAGIWLGVSRLFGLLGCLWWWLIYSMSNIPMKILY